jgi:hypothetical protein
VDATTEAAYAAMVARDWAEVRLPLHPYLHWTGADGHVVRGRTNVLTLLLAQPTPPDPPTAVELCGGQIYRWTS